jgi:hypothetical protein
LGGLAQVTVQVASSASSILLDKSRRIGYRMVDEWVES